MGGSYWGVGIKCSNGERNEGGGNRDIKNKTSGENNSNPVLEGKGEEGLKGSEGNGKKN